MNDAHPDGAPMEVATLDDAHLLRYSRHILLDELGPDAQQKFSAAHALVVGMGGLGTPAAHFLAAAGVGTITICDADHVDLTNLQRQVLYATADIGARKVDAAAQRLSAINPDVRVTRVPERVGPETLAPLVAAADVVLDGCDNFATRHAVNRACVAQAKPLVSGAAIRFDGQIAVFDTRNAQSPCYHCLFGEGEELEETRCAFRATPPARFAARGPHEALAVRPACGRRACGIGAARGRGATRPRGAA